MNRNKLYATIYSMAKEVGLDKDDLYAVLYRDTGKDSMKQCSEKELKNMVLFLRLLKNTQALEHSGMSAAQKKKIYALAYSMNWDKDDETGQYIEGLITKRLSGLCKKYCHADHINWLDKEQAHTLIETLKKLVQKQTKE